MASSSGRRDRKVITAPSAPAQALAVTTCSSISTMDRSWYAQFDAWPVNGNGSRPNNAMPARSSAGTLSPCRRLNRHSSTDANPHAAESNKPFLAAMFETYSQSEDGVGTLPGFSSAVSNTMDSNAVAVHPTEAHNP